MSQSSAVSHGRPSLGEIENRTSSSFQDQIPAHPERPTVAAFPDRSRKWRFLSKMTLSRPKQDQSTQEASVDAKFSKSAKCERRVAEQPQVRQARSEIAENIRAMNRKDAKERAYQYRQDKKSRLADEKGRKQYLGGVAWGFDPLAGGRSVYGNRTQVDDNMKPLEDRRWHIQGRWDRAWWTWEGGKF